MASSRPSSNSPDMMDVAVSWLFLENVNEVTITMALGMVLRGETPEPLLQAIAWDAKPENADQQPSALANARCWAFGFKTLEAALFHLLYTVDGQIARNELANAGKQQA